MVPMRHSILSILLMRTTLSSSVSPLTQLTSFSPSTSAFLVPLHVPGGSVVIGLFGKQGKRCGAKTLLRNICKFAARLLNRQRLSLHFGRVVAGQSIVMFLVMKILRRVSRHLHQRAMYRAAFPFMLTLSQIARIAILMMNIPVILTTTRIHRMMSCPMTMKSFPIPDLSPLSSLPPSPTATPPLPPNNLPLPCRASLLTLLFHRLHQYLWQNLFHLAMTRPLQFVKPRQAHFMDQAAARKGNVPGTSTQSSLISTPSRVTPLGLSLMSRARLPLRFTPICTTGLPCHLYRTYRLLPRSRCLAACSVIPSLYDTHGHCPFRQVTFPHPS